MLKEKKPFNSAIVERVLLIGLESSGKTTLFSHLTGNHVGDEINVKGSTYSIRVQKMADGEFVDSPGIRIDDSLSNHVVKKEIERASRFILVVRGTQFYDELNQLLPLVTDQRKPFVILVSHADKMQESSKRLLRKFMLQHHLPFIVVDSRKVKEEQCANIRSFIYEQEPLTLSQLDLLTKIHLDDVIPKERIFSQNLFDYIQALIFILAIFLVPVVIAYQLSGIIQPLADQFVIHPLSESLNGQPSILKELLVGNYGLLSLGIYSFIWAFPVVVLIGFSTAVVDESGLKDRIVDCLDPPLRKIGLNGQDLVPILTGFGCNVVAVFQTRNCSYCTRTTCISLIAFGSSCSYQIGATLSLFSAAHHVWLFLPYIGLLFLGGILHTRLWYAHGTTALGGPTFIRRSFLQAPTLKGTIFRLKGVVKQFLLQAMPIFILICIFASFLNFFNVIHFIAYLFYPLLALLHLPLDAGVGLAFSMIRKDGMLVFNQGNGALLAQLSVSQLFLLVFMASTLSACFVTIWTIGRELGLKTAAGIVIRQLVTSIICSIFLFVLLFFL